MQLTNWSPRRHCLSSQHEHSQWMGSAPGQAEASQDLRPVGQPEEGLACGGVSLT